MAMVSFDKRKPFSLQCCSESGVTPSSYHISPYVDTLLSAQGKAGIPTSAGRK